mgnify:CR=1 FL=1
MASNRARLAMREALKGETMKRKTLAALVAALVVAGSARAQTLNADAPFALEFWPATPDRTRQVQHWISCVKGARLDFKQRGAVPVNAAVGAFVFVGRTLPNFLGLYKIDRLEITRKPDGTVDEVKIGAICTTGLEVAQ